ncbi:acyltransferase family protein [Lysobacter arvi]|uniref:Acyltransferase n=1 Tax=Lysobacter arvi TaxID=3038776 RepID=A0ABU1CID3_9GAMM|nr:acyltransferase [Lysobacter arvi]MDR0184715.1 acyltransferase [Lysobacter arvi]
MLTSFRTLADGAAQRDNNFNLMRLFAAWLVIYGHSYPVTGSGGSDLVSQLVKVRFSGSIAVDMFFLISGFLISASFERHRLRDYLAARALRIFPALIVCVSLSVFVMGALLTTSPDYWHSSQTWKYLVRNITLDKAQYFLPGVFEASPTKAVNGSIWSLPVEFRLYLWLAGFGLLGLLRGWRCNTVAALGFAAAFVFIDVEKLPPWKVANLWCLAFFATGVLAWVNRARIRLAWPVLVATLAIAAVMRESKYGYLAYFAALSYATFFVAFVPKLPRIRHHDISYGLYLYGWPSQQLVLHFAPGTGPLFNTFWATLLAGVLATLSWRLVERPALDLKRKFGRKPPAAAPAPSPADEPATRDPA